MYAVAAESICVDPNDSATVWMSCYPEGPMRSTDGGMGWETLVDGLGSRVSYAGNISVSPVDSDDVATRFIISVQNGQ